MGTSVKQTIDVSDLDLAKVLAALYNAATPWGMGFMDYEKEPMTELNAREILAARKVFDYLKGRAIKLNFANPSAVDTERYNSRNGQGAAEAIVYNLRQGMDVNGSLVQTHHQKMKMQAGVEALELAATQSHHDGETYTLGADDKGPALKQKVLEALE
jgi:hypothetical protein